MSHWYLTFNWVQHQPHSKTKTETRFSSRVSCTSKFCHYPLSYWIKKSGNKSWFLCLWLSWFSWTFIAMCEWIYIYTSSKRDLMKCLESLRFCLYHHSSANLEIFTADYLPPSISPYPSLNHHPWADRCSSHRTSKIMTFTWSWLFNFPLCPQSEVETH